MTEELVSSLTPLQAALIKLKTDLDFDAKKKTLLELEAQSSQPDFWQDDQKAKQILRELSALRDLITEVASLEEKIEGILSLCELANSSQEPIDLKELMLETKQLEKLFRKLKTQSYLSGQFDQLEIIFSVFSGQGGTEAMDWALMLSRMYTRYFERKDWSYEELDYSPGDEAGIKSVTYLVKAPYAYGYLKGEAGTHRLVRLSPFNADNLRQTSFAGVEVLPSFEEEVAVDVKPEDLDWQFTRAGGHGGQNVNKVSTAVRLTHRPSGIVVSCRTERYQEQNRKIALNMLKAKLWQKQQLEQNQQLQAVKGEHKLAGWGNQIRSYVLHPYHLVKDLRTNIETSNTEAVLDGDLDDFIEAELTLTKR